MKTLAIIGLLLSAACADIPETFNIEANEIRVIVEDACEWKDFDNGCRWYVCPSEETLWCPRGWRKK